MATSDPEHAAGTMILSREESEAIDEAQHTIGLRSRLLCLVLQSNDPYSRYYDEQLHEAMQELAADIAEAQRTIETALARAQTNGGAS